MFLVINFFDVLYKIFICVQYIEIFKKQFFFLYFESVLVNIKFYIRFFQYQIKSIKIILDGLLTVFQYFYFIQGSRFCLLLFFSVFVIFQSECRVLDLGVFSGLFIFWFGTRSYRMLFCLKRSLGGERRRQSLFGIIYSLRVVMFTCQFFFVFENMLIVF